MQRRAFLRSSLAIPALWLSAGESVSATTGTPVATPTSDLEARLDAVLASYAADRRFFGAALMAIDGQLVLRKGYGFADPRTQLANTPETNYQIASITKTFTAALIMQLRDEGKLSLDDPASRYLPDYPNLEQDSVEITIRQLLSHTSGVIDFLSLYDLRNPFSFPPDLATLLDRIKEEPLVFTPGSDFLYSNSGYLYLGQIIREITGQNWAAALAERITEPLGLRRTWLNPPADPAPQAIGYYTLSGLLLPVSQYGRPDLAEAAGGLTSTVDDLLAWDQALWSGKVVSLETVEEMAKPIRNNYGLGLEHTRLNDLPAIGHFGQTVGFRTVYERIPELNATIIVLSNRQDLEIGALADELAAELPRA